MKNNIHVEDVQDNNGDFYKNFKEKLNSVESFPTNYSFKFIVKPELNQISAIEELFKHKETTFAFKDSSNGNYKSITVKTLVKDADEVIEYYKAVSAFESVMML